MRNSNHIQNWNCGRKVIDLSQRAILMGILNVTPDSFSDGGDFFDSNKALVHARQLIADGADIIDIGGESTRPGAAPVSLEEELRRVIPVISALRAESDVLISVDTYKSEVARQAIDAGADIINDISAGTFDPKMLTLAAERKVGVVLMHIQGTPRDMQMNPEYKDVVGEISEFLRERVTACERVGIPRERIAVDPGIGFGKTVAHNLEILRRIGEFHSLGCPILLGASRKSFIGKTTNAEPHERLEGLAAITALALAQGVRMHRVHNVREISRVCKMTSALLGE